MTDETKQPTYPITATEYLAITTRLVNLARQQRPAPAAPLRMREVVGDQPAGAAGDKQPERGE